MNSADRRAWTLQAARSLQLSYKPGDGILFPFGDMTAILRVAQLPIRESLHEGNGLQFAATLARPDLFLWEGWVIAMAGDPIATSLRKPGKELGFYERVRLIEVDKAKPVEIYRRSRPVPNR